VWTALENTQQSSAFQYAEPWEVSLLTHCGRAPRQERGYPHLRVGLRGALSHPQDTTSCTFPLDPTQSRGLASFTQPVALCPQNNVSCLHGTSAWVPHHSCSWTCYLQPDCAAPVLGNSAGSIIAYTEAAFLCVRSWRLLKCTHCLWSRMTSRSKPPTNNSLGTEIHHPTPGNLQNFNMLGLCSNYVKE